MSNKSKIREEARKLNPIDDLMFRKMAENKDFCQEILRVRYNGAILTTNIADPGIKFENVPDVCVIFISKFDLFKGNLPLYHVDRVIRETGKTVNNSQTSIQENRRRLKRHVRNYGANYSGGNKQN